MKQKLIFGAVGAAILAGGALQAAQAAPIVVNGDFIQVKVSDDGTIGDGNTLPALIYDPTGTGTFDPSTDYVAPGIPFEAFGFRSNQTGLIDNRNSGSAGGSVGTGDDFNMSSLVDLSGGSFDNHIRWIGTSQDGRVGIQHDFFFADDSERINLQTMITALTENLTGVRFSRAVDPDPDNVPGGSADTANQRGLDSNNDGDFDDPGDLAPRNFVTSVGTISGRPLGLFSNSSITHNTGIESACCSVVDPDEYLAGGDFPTTSTGDHGLGIGFNIGSLAQGQSVTIDYAYVMGTSLGTIDVPDDDDPTDPVGLPVPGTWALFGLGLGLAGVAARRRQRR